MIEATVTGNVGKVNELRITKSGKAMLTFSVASTEKKDGPTTWVEVVCFDEQAETCSQTLLKGQRVVVSGRMGLETYEKKDGSQGFSLRLMANEVGVSLRWPKREPAGVGADDEIPFA
jgi:single-strand DNA-binding protein